jgi:hypothetical protein
MALMQKFMDSEKPTDIDPPPNQRRYDDHRKQIDASEMAPLTAPEAELAEWKARRGENDKRRINNARNEDDSTIAQ